MRRRDFIAVSAGLTVGAGLHGAALAAKQSQQIGVNCFDLFYGSLVDPKRVRKPGERLREMAGVGIPFVRFAASPFWPNEWRIYKLQRNRYLDLLAEVSSEAQRSGVRLVPTLFWNPSSVSDYLGEPTSAWARKDSKTQEFARAYVADVIPALSGGSAVDFWEFGNEFNVNLDYPDGRRWWPKVNQDMGTPARRTEDDVISSRGYTFLLDSFCGWVKAIAPAARVSSGSDRPHPSAYNLSIGKLGPDTTDQFRRSIKMANPACSEVASIHLYPDMAGAYFGKTSDVRSVLQEARQATRESGQTLFLGEFGVPSKGSEREQRSTFASFLDAIQIAQVDLAALWVYDFHYQPDFSVTPQNERSWQLQEVVRWNEAAARRSGK